MKISAENKLINHFKHVNSFSRKDLFNYFLQSEGALNEGTLGWRIYDLKRKNILREVQRGLYTIDIKPVYTQEIGGILLKLAEVFTANYRNAPYCIWHVSSLNEFTVHQFNRNNIIFETEKDLLESVAHTFADGGYNSIKSSLYGQLISYVGARPVVLLQPLISRAPIQRGKSGKGKTVFVPTLEKMLVDIYVHENIFHFVQGAEMEKIFRHAIGRYAINYTTLLSYARRRGKEDGLRSYLQIHFPELVINSKK